MRVLLAEDNHINQELVLAILRKLGHEVEVVESGCEAVEAVAAGGFDLVLMDVQMPGMDGQEAAARIREREEATGGHIPIVALTAHTIVRDRESCLSAGMDEYVSKPIRQRDLLEAMRRALGEGQGPEAAFSLETAREEVEGNEELLRRMAAVFLESLPGMLSRLREAVGAGDGVAMRRGAHKLKGSYTQFHAGRATELAERMEEMTSLTEAAACLVELETESMQLVKELELWQRDR